MSQYLVNIPYMDTTKIYENYIKINDFIVNINKWCFQGGFGYSVYYGITPLTPIKFSENKILIK